MDITIPGEKIEAPQDLVPCPGPQLVSGSAAWPPDLALKHWALLLHLHLLFMAMTLAVSTCISLHMAARAMKDKIKQGCGAEKKPGSGRSRG